MRNLNISAITQLIKNISLLHFVIDMLAIFRHQYHGVTRCRLDGIKPQTKPFTSLFTPIAICQIATSGRD